MFDFLNKDKTTKLDKIVEEEAYMKEKIKQAEIIGKTKAKQEAKEEIKEMKNNKKTKSNGGFAKFQDYCTGFAKNQPNMIGSFDMNLGGTNGKNNKRSRKRNRAGIRPGIIRI